jgi:hypothetical protein
MWLLTCVVLLRRLGCQQPSAAVDPGAAAAAALRAVQAANATAKLHRGLQAM